MNCNISRILSPRFRGGDHLSKRPEPGTDNAAGSGIVPYLALLRKGLAMRPGSLRSPVVSYTAVSPLPDARKRPAVCSLLRCPFRGVAPAASLLMRDFLPYGVRTFLFARQSGRRCNSHFLLYHAPAKMQAVLRFFPQGNAEASARSRMALHGAFSLFFRSRGCNLFPCMIHCIRTNETTM